MKTSTGQVADNEASCGSRSRQLTEINHHPLIFTLQDAISGNGFLAGITLVGRALMQQDDESKWWLYGVCPGSLAESGDSPQDAFMRFRNRYREVLIDIAQEQPTFKEFKAEVERFFHEVDEQDARRWEDALIAIRSGNLGLPEPFSGLPRERPEQKPCAVTVEELSREGKDFLPSHNVVDTFSKAA